MARWDPWRGCHRYSEGCKFCYIHKGDAKRGVDTNCITKTDKFDAPIVRKKNGEYKMKSGLVYVCFSSDFLLEDADPWRSECWDMIRQRQDCQFLFLTKRIERFMDCIPSDWGDGWDNVIVGCTVENQQRADERLDGNTCVCYTGSKGGMEYEIEVRVFRKTRQDLRRSIPGG